MARILVVGGAGAFGSRLAEGLAATTDFEIAIAGRDPARAQAAAVAIAARHPAARVEATRLDATTVRPDDLAALAPSVVVDAAGPFQSGSYRLATGTIGAGAHYLDLADGRDFVAGFPALDGLARQTGVVALTGMSSTPALSNTVLDHMTSAWRAVHTVAIAIAPGNRAPRGLSVMRAILGYAGHPVRVWSDGRWAVHPGWGLMRRETVGGLGPRWLSLCETPDLDLVPARFPGVRAAVFRAGLELPVLHLGLWLASQPVRWGLVRSLAPMARTFRAMANLLSGFGTDRGGMVVAASGLDASGRPVASRWLLIAESGSGPYVPTLPALAAIRRVAAGLVAPGARVGTGILALGDIEAEMKRHAIATSFAPS